MTAATNSNSTRFFSLSLILLGVLAVIAGAVGTLLVGWMLGHLLPQWLGGRLGFFTWQLLFQALWLFFFINLFSLGLKLIRSGRDGRQHDVVPGLTLYFLGAALAMIGVMLFVFGSGPVGAGLFAAGALAILVEWSTEVV